MREIAKASGVANGGLFPYFRDKQELLGATFEHVFAATNQRFAEVRQGRVGIAALRELMLQILPLDDERVLESRIVIPFWEYAVNEPQLRELHERTVELWSAEFADDLEAAKRLGEVRADVDVERTTDQLLAMLNGAQVLAVLSPERSSPEQLTAMLDNYLLLLR